MKLQEKVLLELLDNAKQSDSRIAKKLGCAQSTVFRARKQLEDNNTVWGYSAIVDWNKLGYSLYSITVRTKPATKEGARLVIKGLEEDYAGKYGVKLLNVFMMFGEYEWCLLVASSDEQAVHKYINYLREKYSTFFEHRPKHARVIFPCKQQGHINPKLRKLEKLGLEIESGKA
jgi:DNA-binding Lrp family transcriptional regulator